MTSLTQRQTLITPIDEACLGGARHSTACTLIGQSARTLQRWRTPAHLRGDRRQTGLRTHAPPAHALSEAERKKVLDVVNSHEFKDLPPSQIAPRLSNSVQHFPD